ncbi:MAG: tetratricopeptide repeat protein [Hamadaea sp.]|nr:tetratricopeptide repeat protein [Hamadaea sp.]
MLITSRYRLAGLAGAALTELDVLSPAEAYALLARIVGADRLATDGGAAHRIVTACGRLPLAIRIAGARLAARRQLPLGVLADRLADERRRLDELSAGDLAVRSSIGLSYRALDGRARTALGRMSHLGLPDFSTWVVGWLLATTPADAEKTLEVLVDAQLASFSGVDAAGVLRYRLHDLVRLYARERAEAHEPVALTDAIGRVFDGWTAVLSRVAADDSPAEARLQPMTEPAVLPDPAVHKLRDNIDDWLAGEEPALAVAVERAAALGLPRHICDLVGAHTAVEHVTNRFEMRDRLIGVAMGVARSIDDPRHHAGMVINLAGLRYAQDRFAEAQQCYEEALALFRTLHDVPGQAVALAGMGIACREPGHLAEAVRHLSQADSLSQALGDQSGIGHVLRIRGSVLLEQGEYAAALSDLNASLEAYHRVGSRRGVGLTLRSIGLYHRALGAYDEAMAACGQACEIFAEIGDGLMHSYAVRAHAKVQMRIGRSAEALPRLEGALATARDNDDRWGQAATLRVLGQLHLGDGRLDLAQSHLDAAMSIWDTMESPVWRARTEYDLSQLYHRRGDTVRAEAAFASALAVFTERGSREHRELRPTPTG